MLSNGEQRRLVEIEFWLQTADPRLARCLREHRKPGPGWSAMATSVVVTSLPIALAGLLFDGITAVAAGLIVFGLGAAVWAIHQ